MTIQLSDIVSQLDQRSAAERDAVEAAEGSAVVIWRGERLPYGEVPARVAATSGRAARNGLFDAYQEAVAAINPLRERWYMARVAAARELGFSDLAALQDATAGYRIDDLLAEVQLFLFESETFYFAALRRYLALIDIELGDATEADLSHILRGAGFSAWFDPRDLGRITGRTAADLGITPPEDLVANDAAGHATFRAALGRLGASLVPDDGRDPAIRMGSALLLERLLLEDEWLEQRLGVPETEIPVLADFLAFVALHRLRREAGLLIYELRLHRGAETTLAQAYFSGTVGLLIGARVPESEYLSAIGNGFESAVYHGASSLAGALRVALEAQHGSGWWRSAATGETLGQMLRSTKASNAGDVVAQLGYNRLDWRPVLRQIRTQLIGEMSGYGGPNITTRAGTRKV